MKIFTMCAAALSALLLAAGAQASESSLHVSPYLSFKAGASFLNLDKRCNDDDPNLPANKIWDCSIDHDTAFSMRPAIGLNFYSGDLVGIRTEVEWYSNNAGKFKNPMIIYMTNWYENDEGELVYGPNSFEGELHQKIKNQALMFNTYADFHVDRLVTPYVGLGLGMSKIKNEYTAYGIAEHTGNKVWLEDGKTTTRRLAVDGSAGFLINFNDHIGLDFGATYYYFGTVRGPMTRQQTLTDFNLDAGLRITF